MVFIATAPQIDTLERRPAFDLLGQIGLFYLMQKYQRNSYIAFSIGGIVALFLMTAQSLLSMANSGGPKPPSGLCTGKH